MASGNGGIATHLHIDRNRFPVPSTLVRVSYHSKRQSEELKQEKKIRREAIVVKK